MSKNNPTTPKLTAIYFYLMDSCNLSCRHCWISPDSSHQKKNQALPLEKIKNVIRQALPLGLRQVKLTGGEPLLYPEIIGLLQLLKENNLGSTMETNGTLLTPLIARSLKENGTWHVAISLDGADAATHENLRQVKGSFEAALNGARLIAGHKINLQIIMAVHRNNISQAEKLARLAKDLGAVSIKLNYINTLGRGRQMKKNGELLSLKEIIDFDIQFRKNPVFDNKFSFFSNIPLAFKDFKNFRRYPIVCNVKNILGILGSGKISLCGIGQEIPELIFGDIDQHQLADIWENNPLLKEIRDKKPQELGGVCQKCIYQAYCFSTCLAENYYYNKAFFKKGFWFCEEAKKKNLFPISKTY